MTPDALRRVLVRELRTAIAEIDAYPDDAAVWACPPPLPNAAGTLALHLAGNLRYFVGARLGGTGYVRDRPREFGARDLSRAELRAELEAALADVDRALGALDPARLAEPYPEPIGGAQLTVGLALLHVAAHCGYHLGQMDYHRRVVTGQPKGVGAMVPGALVDN
jgi:hypothetical protein